jgi:hypothetical protein
MKGDFSRWTFDRTKRYDRVLSLQGRVFLDADFNEGMELQLQRLRKLTADVLGPHAGPGASGFSIVATNPPSKDFFISSGSYYVNGILCENPDLPPPAQGQPDPGPRYLTQPFLPKPDDLKAGTFIAYLDVWERFLTCVEDEDRTPAELQQSIREVALGGPDTAARSQVVWQLRVLPVVGAAPPDNDDANFEAFLKKLRDLGTIRTVDAGPHRFGRVKMRARKPKGDDLPCATNPESKYRGPENQLYRVEIHTGGAFGPAGADSPTFKWSRDNGSVIFPIQSLEGPTVVLETIGRDERLGLKQGDWVEVVDDAYVLQNRAEPLLKVKSVDAETRIVELSAPPASPVGTVQALHPILRRWDGTAPVSVNPDPDSEGYLSLEDGVQVHFSAGDYRTSDYWIAPARTATGDVEWPGPVDSPQEVPPHGIMHAYAPLAVINIGATVTVASSMRRQIDQLWS